MYDTYKCIKNYKNFQENGKYMGFYDETEGFIVYDIFGGKEIIPEEIFYNYFKDIIPNS